MSGRKYPLNDRIDACERELKQLNNDTDHLTEKFVAKLPTGRFGYEKKMLRVVYSRTERRQLLEQVEGCIAAWTKHQRYLDSFRSVLGTVRKECPLGSRREARVSVMLAAVDELDEVTGHAFEMLANLHPPLLEMTADLDKKHH